MISFEVAKKLKESGVFVQSERSYGKMMKDMVIYYHPAREHYIDTFPAPTFEELWAMLPLCINVNNITYFLQLEKLYSCEVISYCNSIKELDKQKLIKSFNDECTKSLSDLAAEMLIELKNRGMI